MTIRYNQAVLNILHALPPEMQEEINHDRVSKILSGLTPREEHIVRLYFGIDTYEPKNTYRIADKLGVSQFLVHSTIQKIKSKIGN